MTEVEAEKIIKDAEDGLEKAMIETRIKCLSTDNIIRFAKYAVKSGVVTVGELSKITKASRTIEYFNEQKGL